jgi:hypothetical protein
MLLTTKIVSRKDGTVKVAGIDGHLYVFTANAAGMLVCDVDEAALPDLLRSGNFWPVNWDEEQSALLLAATQGEGEGDTEGEGEFSDGELLETPNGLPVEANTPPQRFLAKSAKKK